MLTWVKDAFHLPAVLIGPVCPARQKCFLSSILHIVFLLKKPLLHCPWYQQGATKQEKPGFSWG